jgi:nucleotidyltransferase/DNA polymerase involved in DNA repair
MPYACIFVPDFPVEAVLRAEPELRARPVAVLEGKPPLQKVLGVNEKARQLGIEPGMSKIQVEPCTELTLRARSPLQEAAAHAALLDCAQSFSPRVEDTAPDTVILDLAGLESLFGPPARIARDLARRASDLGLEVHVAAASNPDTATFAARGFSGITIIPEGKEAERLGSLPLDVLFPELTAAATPVSPGELPAQPSQPKSPQLAQRTPQKTGKTPASISKEISATKTAVSEAARFLETFDLWGVRNLRGLAALPDVALTQRLGQAGLRLQQLARGATTRTLMPVDLPLIFEEAIDLDHPLVLLEPLAFLLAHMLDQLSARLAARALAAQELRLQLELDTGFHFIEDIPTECVEADASSAQPSEARLNSVHETNAKVGTAARGSLPRAESRGPGRAQARQKDGTSYSAKPRPRFTRTLQLPVPMLDPKTFLKLLQLDLNANPPGAPILKIHLSAEPARPRRAQSGLFQPPTPEPEKLELTLARIAGMVGPSNVGGAELLDTHAPEAFRMQRFIPVALETKSKNPRPKNQKAGEHLNKEKASASLQHAGTATNHVGTAALGSLPRAESRGPADPQARQAPITALRIFRPPLQATVTLRNGQPTHLLCQRRKEISGDILWMAGPWRSSGDWWEQDGWSRDEWDIAIQLPVARVQLSVGSGRLLFGNKQSLFVGKHSWQERSFPETTTLALYRLVHDLLNARWFVEGTYD